MTLKPLDGFRHFTTHHCVTGSMRHIYEFHGYPISEDLLLGLGSGIGFVYWHMKGTDPFLGGRANVGRPGEEGLEKTAGKRTGVNVSSFHTGSAKKAEKALVDMLISGEPAMVQLDMGFLPYFDFRGRDYHFGGHAVVIAGYDPETREVLIADRDEELHSVSMEVLSRARGSRFKPFPPRNTWCTFDFGGRRAPTPKETWKAIRETATRMLKPPIANLGVRGIRIAAQRILKWPLVMDEEKLRWACFNVYIFIDEKGGSGGGNFRYMYGRFLREASVITGNNRLGDVGDKILTIGNQWQQVAETLRDSPTARHPASLLPKASELILKIAHEEQDSWQQLRELAACA